MRAAVLAGALASLGLACLGLAAGDSARAPLAAFPARAPSAGNGARPLRLGSVMRLRGAGNAEADDEKDLGNAAYKVKDFAAALMHYEAAAALDPTSMVYVNNIAAALAGQGKHEECLAKSREALEVGKANRANFKDLARAYARAGNALVRLGRLEEAVKEYDSSLLEHKDGMVELKRKDVIRKFENDAEEAYKDPEKAEEARQLGNSFFKEGKWPEAIKAYSDGIKRDASAHLIYSNRAQAYIKVMDLGSALKDCDACIKIKPDFPRAYARKATVQILCKQVHRAKETVDIGLVLCPDNQELLEAKMKVQRAALGVGLSPEEREERAKEAMKDPEIVNIMQDPIMRDVLNDMQVNPSSAQKHMQNPGVKAKIEKLIAAGIIQTG